MSGLKYLTLFAMNGFCSAILSNKLSAAITTITPTMYFPSLAVSIFDPSWRNRTKRRALKTIVSKKFRIDIRFDPMAKGKSLSAHKQSQDHIKPAKARFPRSFGRQV